MSGNLQTTDSVTSAGSAVGAGAVIGDAGTVEGSMIRHSSHLVAQPGGFYILQGYRIDRKGFPVKHITSVLPMTAHCVSI